MILKLTITHNKSVYLCDFNSFFKCIIATLLKYTNLVLLPPLLILSPQSQMDVMLSLYPLYIGTKWTQELFLGWTHDPIFNRELHVPAS